MVSLSLSVLIPLYNEEEFIGELLARVVRAPLPAGMERELVVVDDGSTDLSAEVVETFIAAHPGVAMRLIRHKENQGKGAAIRTAIASASGMFSIIQDADLEYDPAEYRKMLAPLVRGEADVVYGSRFVVAGERRVLYYWHSLANRMLTLLCNILADLNLTDMETCYKAFRTSFAQSIPIESDRFGIEPELTIKFARRKARIYEVAISYHGRTYAEGKKIGPRDALEALWVIVRSRFSRKLYTDVGLEILDALSYAPNFNRWMAETMIPFIGQNVLEIGAGTGNLTRHFCPHRKHYLAAEIDPERVEQLRNRFAHRPTLEILCMDAANPASFEPLAGRFDTVVCVNVLEHIKDDAAMLHSIASALEPGGRLVLLVPNDPAAFGTLDECLGHYRRYTPEGLATLLAASGFRLEQMIRFNRISWPAWRFTGQVQRSKTLSRSALAVFNRLVWLWRRIDASLPWPATSLIAIARRPE